jgi:hypothetical protein
VHDSASWSFARRSPEANLMHSVSRVLYSIIRIITLVILDHSILISDQLADLGSLRHSGTLAGTRG